jgi:gamma-glutamyltranspeptidase / glutathione hydrolase
MKHPPSLVYLMASTLWLASCSTAPNTPQAISSFVYQPLAAVQQPEGASGFSEKKGWTTSKFAVAAANPLATDAGYQVLKAGGSALDAAIAVQMVLGLVEPQSSGIGGGAFLLHQAADKKCASVQAQARTQPQSPCGLQAFDGRETAPALATENLLLGADGKPIAFIDAVVGGKSVGTMGTVRMLELAHQQHGKLPWSALFQPAIQLASEGFKVSPRMNTLLHSEVHLKKDAVAAAYFYDAAGKPWPVGHVLKNPEYAEVLKLIAAKGSKALHEGEVAQAVVNKVQSHPTNAGKLSMTDLAGYTPKVREALCTDYSAHQKQYVICGMPPPSSGAIAVSQILGMLNGYITANPSYQEQRAAILAVNAAANAASSLRTFSPQAPWLHGYTEASRLAFADRAQYVADPDFVQAPAGDWKSLVAPDYLAARAKLIGEQSMKTAKPGNPAGAKSAYAPMPHQPEFGTSHISIVDGFGNALAMTTTIEDAWGSRQMVNRGKLDANGKPILGGFLLNNELTDFSFAPTDADGKSIANRVQPGKRPRSSMSPTLVFDKATGHIVASVGSPGGALIIHYTAKTLYGMLNWGLNAQEAINLPNFGSLNGPTILEENRFPAATIEALKARGHEIREVSMTSGLQGIQTTRDSRTNATGFFGGADPRREGVVRGD